MEKQSVTIEGETMVSTPDTDGDETNVEWKLFQCVLFKEFNKLSMDQVFSNMLTNETIVRYGINNEVCVIHRVGTEQNREE